MCVMVFVEFEANETRKLRWHDNSTCEGFTHNSDPPWLLAPDCWLDVRALVSVEKGRLRFNGCDFFHIVQHPSLPFLLVFNPSIRILLPQQQRSKILLYYFFWTILRRLNFMYRRFGTLFHLHKSFKQGCLSDLWRWNSVPKRRHIKFRRWGITQKKECNIHSKAKFWNHEVTSFTGRGHSFERPAAVCVHSVRNTFFVGRKWGQVTYLENHKSLVLVSQM